MKNKTFFSLFIIILISVLFRIWHLDKSYGLWNDEYVGWMIASEPNITDFISKVFNNCHTPLYYFYLKLWMYFAGDSDLSLRISSVIPSVLTLPVIFMVGKELKDNETGFIALIIAAISSFCIYYSQEVRLYSLLILISSLIILYFIKSAKNKSKNDIIIFIVFNAILCLTHTLGIIFSTCIIFCLFYYLQKDNSQFINKINYIKKIAVYILPFIITILLISPLLLNILFSKNLSQFWTNFSITKIIFNFSDYYSPVLTNFSTTPNNLLNFIYQYGKINYIYIIFGLVPLIISASVSAFAILNKNKILNFLLSSCLIFYLILIILSLSGKMVLSTKYSSEIYPALVLMLAAGFTLIKKDYIKKILLIIYIGINLIYLLFSPTSAPKLERTEGNLAPVKLIETSRLNYKDQIILLYYDVDKFKKYSQSIDKYNIYSINKFNFNKIIYNNDDYYETIKKGKLLYRYKFKTFPDKSIQNLAREQFINGKPQGSKIGILLLENVTFLNNQSIQDILKDESKYNKTPFIFLVFSNLKNNLMYSLKDEYKIDTITQAGDWTLIVFEKIR